jgi:membrane-associated phospholipid phosphatase
VDGVYDLGTSFIQALQTLSPALDGPMQVFRFLGEVEFYLILLPLLYWIVSPALGMRVLVLLIAVDAVTNVLRLLFHQPRPYWLGGVRGIVSQTSYGLPSGHASGSVAVWGYLAYHARRRWLWLTALALILLIGLASVYVGVHFPHDILAGWLVGLALLVLYIAVERRAVAWLRQLSLATQIGLALAASFGLIVATLLVRQAIAGIPDPATWAMAAQEARSVERAFMDAGTLFGGLTGFLLMQRHAPFLAGGAWASYLGRFLVGMIGVLLAWRGLAALFAVIAADGTILGDWLRYIRYALTALWITLGAPWLFLRLRLAKPLT